MPLFGDSLDGMQNPDSTAITGGSFSSIHIGVVTGVAPATQTGFVRIPALNADAQLGPFKFVQPFTNTVTTPVKQTLSVSTGVADPGVTVVTGVSLSATTTDINATIGALNLPSVGERVLVVFLDDSLDQGIIVGKI
jgi:hypothetical protein